MTKYFLKNNTKLNFFLIENFNFLQVFYEKSEQYSLSEISASVAKFAIQFF